MKSALLQGLCRARTLGIVRKEKQKDTIIYAIVGLHWQPSGTAYFTQEKTKKKPLAPGL